MAKNANPTVLEAEVVDSLPDDLQASQEQMDAILNADFDDPTTEKVKQSYSTRNLAWQYFKSIQHRLPKWWELFSTAIDQNNGGPKYKTIFQFAKSRTKNPKEIEWICSMLGPKPSRYNQRDKNKTPQGIWLSVPWLGNWMYRRNNGYWAPEDPNKIKELSRSIKTKLQGFEAVQSSAPYLVQEMAVYMRLSEQIDQVFAGQPLDLSKGISDENKARFYTYLEMKKAVTRVKIRLLHEWWAVHGVGIGSNQVNYNSVTNNTIVAGRELPASAKDMEAIKLARMLSTHADNFQMPLPKDREPEKAPVKTNGKVM